MPHKPLPMNSFNVGKWKSGIQPECLAWMFTAGDGRALTCHFWLFFRGLQKREVQSGALSCRQCVKVTRGSNVKKVHLKKIFDPSGCKMFVRQFFMQKSTEIAFIFAISFGDTSGAVIPIYILKVSPKYFCSSECKVIYLQELSREHLSIALLLNVKSDVT